MTVALFLCQIAFKNSLEISYDQPALLLVLLIINHVLQLCAHVNYTLMMHVNLQF